MPTAKRWIEAKRTSCTTALTRAGHFVGTPDYMPPEQIRGERVHAGADVYAPDCLLFHALTGEPLAGGSRVQIPEIPEFGTPYKAPIRAGDRLVLPLAGTSVPHGLPPGTVAWMGGNEDPGSRRPGSAGTGDRSSSFAGMARSTSASL